MSVPGLTACSLCAGDTLGRRDPAPGGQRARLEQLESEGITRLALSECLDACGRGDVVVARPSATGRAMSGRPVWFERLAGDERTAALRSWLTRGGPGVTPVPNGLKPLVIQRGGAEPGISSR